MSRYSIFNLAVTLIWVIFYSGSHEKVTLFNKTLSNTAIDGRGQYINFTGFFN